MPEQGWQGTKPGQEWYNQQISSLFPSPPPPPSPARGDGEVFRRSGLGLALLLSVLLHLLAAASFYYCPLRSPERARFRDGPVLLSFVQEESTPSHHDGPGEEGARLQATGVLESSTPTPSSTPTEPVNGQPTSFAELSHSVKSTGSEQRNGPGSSATGPLFGQGRSQATTSFFQIETQGQRIVYLIDSSASMGRNGAWSAACRELLASIQRLPPSVRFQVVVYNSNPRLLVPRLPDWLEPGPATLRQVAQALAELPVEGRTDHLPALRFALHAQPDVLFFLTDADDLEPEHLRQVQILNRGRTVIHTIELNQANRHRPGMPMQILARANRGTYQAVNLEDYR